MIDWAIGAAMVLVLLALLWMIVTGRLSRGEGGGIASLTAFHDFQPKDGQQAVEIIIEQKAGKKVEEQSTGEGNKHEPEQIHD